MKPFEVNETTTGRELASKYIFRQNIKLFPLMFILVGAAFTYTITTLNFVPLLRIDLLSWVIMIALMYYSDQSMNSEFEKYIHSRKLGKPMDWSLILFHGWTLFFVKNVLMYWLVLVLWLAFYNETPKETLEQLYDVIPKTP